MRRVPPAVWGALLLIAGVALLLWRWQAFGFSPGLAIVGILCLVGVPGSLWLVLGRRPAASLRPMPRTFWLGLLLVAVGLLGSLLGIPAGSYGAPSLSFASSSPPQRLHFVALPRRVTDRLHVLFPRLTVGRTLRPTGAGQAGSLYEIWLRRPGARTYTLQITWAKGGVQIENQGLNTLYQPRSGTPLSLSALRGRYRFNVPVYGPVVFPGYVLYVSLSKDYAFVIDRLSGNVAGGEGW